MPRLTFGVTHSGLAVPVWIGLSGTTTAALLAAGQPLVAPVQAQGLLDTGSDATAVASWLLQRLAVPAATTAVTHTAAGQVKVKLYEVSLGITGLASAGGPWLAEPDLLVAELATVLPDADVLVGLDVLLRCRLVLDGPARQFSLDF